MTRTFVIPDTNNADRSYFVGELLDLETDEGAFLQKIAVTEIRQEGEDLVLVCESVQ